jgi:LysM repeat protein
LKTKYWLAVLILVVGALSVGSGLSVPAGAQPLTHKVEKGDTLWDICEKYYGDPDLWPKLWQMNPFVTNPHLLKPGDIITLLEDVPIKKQPPVEEAAVKPTEILYDSSRDRTGIDVSGLIDVESIGFLTVEDFEPFGHIFSDETERSALSEGDTVYVSVEKGNHAEPGSLFTIYRKSPLLNHPLSGERLGYSVSFLGKLVVKEPVKEGIYKAEIVASYTPMHEGDPILSYNLVSSCVQPVPSDGEVVTRIVAVKDQNEIIGQFSVVYLEAGTKKGIRRGNLFEIVRKNQPESPEKAVLPDVKLGDVLVLEARPDTATGVVIAAREEFANGAYLKGLDWEKTRYILSRLPECHLE